MSLMEANALDMAAVLIEADRLGEMINQSEEVIRYLYWKRQVDANPDVSRLQREFDRKKELYEETKRFGHYHPDYHAALGAAKAMEAELEKIEAVREFKKAEEALDDLLYTLSSTIAHAVSESIKVPSNNPLPTKGCGSGGACGCG